jgi:asparagine synthase (glutamine-hydrolysing)
MCAIAGILINPNADTGYNRAVLAASIQKMNKAQAHRGPDGEGMWINQAGMVGLGHRRLAVIDLSEAASQPMQRSLFSNLAGEEKRYTITYNGEIYNYRELRDILHKNGYRFHSQSDTEVILAAYDFWEEECIKKFDGMFAFAIWDAKKYRLFAARDRFGEKPFYFYHGNGLFMLASEMKALWAAGVPKNADPKMLLNYITLGHLQNPIDKEQTFFEQIYALPASHYLYFDLDRFDYQVHAYWHIDKELTRETTTADAVEQFSHLLATSIKRRLRSDVPIGSSLSGGLDSSAINAFIYEQQAGRHLAFSAVFPGFDKDESVYIKSVAKRFELKNFTVAPNGHDFVKQFEKLCWHQEEPFQSSSIFAQYKVFELAAGKQVKVMLDGQGADEILAGYHKYIHWYIQQLINRKKYSTAMQEKNVFYQHNIKFKWGLANYLATFLPAHTAIQLEQREYKKIIKHPDINGAFINDLRGREWEGIYKPIVTKLNDILYFNTMQNGLEELLRFTDRNSMAHGVEARLPFLYHELVEFVFSLPANCKIHEGWTKWLLRKTLNKKLPAGIVWSRDKIAFETPQKKWMALPPMTDYVHEARRKLVNNGILKGTVLNKPIEPLSAGAPDNYDWRYLCVAQVI